MKDLLGRSRLSSCAHIPCHRLCCALLVLLAGGCAPRSSPELLERVQAIERQHRTATVEAGIRSAISSYIDFVDLAEDATGTGHELVNGAYAQCGDAPTRELVVRLAGYRYTGRYVPLLSYVAQFDPACDVRLTAASSLSLTKGIESPLSRSVIVAILGGLLQDAKDSREREEAAYYLERFLLETCNYPIPGAERREGLLVTGSKVKVHVQRVDPALVVDWWETAGEQLAATRAFD